MVRLIDFPSIVVSLGKSPTHVVFFPDDYLCGSTGGQVKIYSNNWLVVWNMNFIFPNSWDDDPI